LIVEDIELKDRLK